MPDKGLLVSKSSVNRFAEGLREIRNYLKIKACRGFTAAIILSGHHTEDGVMFGGRQTVPVEVLERQIRLILESRGKQLTPAVVDLITVRRSGINILTVNANEEAIERCRVVTI